tara:strand:+ start:2511 stop:4424 length:1914 start_codon:yes stop_codon:yes gene_type:complete
VGNFKEFSAQERSYSDIAPPKEGVADTSGAHKMSAIAGAISAVGSVFEVGAGAYYKGKELEAKETEAKGEAAQARNKEDFSKKLVSASDMVAQPGGSDIKTAAFLTKAFNESTLDHDTKTKMMRDYQGTVLGKPLTEVSEDQKAEKAFNERFAKSPFYDRDASLDDQELNKVAFEKSILEKDAHDLEMRRLTLEAAQAKGSKEKEAKVAKEVEKVQKTRLTRLVQDLPKTITANLNDLKSAYEQEAAEGDPSVALVNYKKALASAKTMSASTFKRVASQSKSGFPVHLASALETSNAMYDTEIKYAGTAEVGAERKAAVERVVVDTQLAMLNQSKSLKVTAAASSLVKGANISLDIQALTDVNNYFLEGEERADGGRASNLDPSQDGVDDYYEVVRKNLANIDKTNADGSPVVNTESLTKQIGNMLAYSSDSEGKLDLGEYSNVVGEMANPSFGTFLKTVKGAGLNQKDLANAQMALSRYAEDVTDSFNGFLRDTMTDSERAAKAASTNPRGRHSVSRKVTEDDLELVFVNDRVVFKGNDEKSRSFAEGLNNRASKQLTDTVWASSNIGSSSPEQVFNYWLPKLWPDKYGEQQEPTTQESVSDIDYSQHEGESGKDEEGNRFIIRNGVPVKVGGDGG